MEKLKKLIDKYPVEFSEWLAKHELYDYQKKFIQDDSKRIVFCACRQCFHENEYILTKNGMKKVKDLNVGEELIDGSIVLEKNEFIGDGWFLRIQGLGYLVVSDNHLFLTKKGWKTPLECRLDNLDIVAKPISYFDDLEFNKDVDLNDLIWDEVKNRVLDFIDIKDEYLRDFLLFLINNTILVVKKEIKNPAFLIRGYFSGKNRINSALAFQFLMYRMGLLVGINIKDYRVYWTLKMTSFKRFAELFLDDIDNPRLLNPTQEQLEKWKEMIRKFIETTVDYDFVDINDLSEFYVRIEKMERIKNVRFVAIKTSSERLYSYCGIVSHNCGKTTITALKSICNALKYDDYEILVVSRTIRQSRNLMERIIKYVRNRKLIESLVTKCNSEEIVFMNNSRIRSLPGNPNNVRGFTANMVIVDEASFVPDELFETIEPTLASTDGSLILISSPYKKEGYFWKAWNSDEYSKYRVVCYDVPHIPKEFIEEFRKMYGDIVFRREMLAEFVSDDEDEYVPLSLIESLCVLDEWNKNEKDLDVIIGVDIARFGEDYTCVAVIVYDNIDELFKVVKLYLWKKKSISYTIGKLKSIIDKWKPIMVVVDSCGLGGGVYDVLKDEFGSLINDVNLHSQRKRTAMYLNLRDFIMEEKILFPRAHKDEILSHFGNIEIVYDVGGIKIRKKSSGHDDIVDAIALGMMGWKEFGFGSGKVYVFEDLNLDLISGTDDYHEFDFGNRMFRFW